MEKIHTLAYSKGNLVFSYGKGNLAIVEIDSGRTVKVATNLNEVVTSLDIDVQHNNLAISNLSEAILMNWESGEVLFSTKVTEVLDPQNVLFVNADSLVVSGNSAVVVYDFADNTYFDQFSGLSQEVVVTALKKDNTLICADYTGTINFFRMSDNKRTMRYKVTNNIYKVAVIEQLNFLYTWHGAFASKWDINTGEHILDFQTETEFKFEFTGGALSHATDILISTGSSGLIYLWDTSTGQLIKTLEGHQDDVTGFAVTEDNILYSCGWDGVIRSWNLDNFEGEELKITGLD